jgi:tetratricopeptide (TPR) repeat protein
MSKKSNYSKPLACMVSFLLCAQPAMLVAAEGQRGTLPLAYSGLNPAQARALRGEITRLAGQLDLREDLLAAIARILEVDLRGAGFERLISVLQTKAADARIAKREIVALRISLAAARRPVAPVPAPPRAKAKAAPPATPAPRAPLNPAEQLLAQAEAAFDAGRLDEADRLLARLAPLRGDRLGLDLRAWQEVVQTRGKVMALAGRAQEASDYLLDAEAAIAELSRQARLVIIRQAADTLFERALAFGGTAELAQAANIYSNRALPLAPRDTALADWAWLQIELGNVLQVQGERTGGADSLALLAASVRAYESVLSVYTQRDMPAVWVATQNNLGGVLRTQGQRNGGVEGLALLAASVRAYKSALSVLSKRDTQADWAATQNNLGAVLAAQGELTAGAEGLALLAASVRAFESAQSVRTQRDMPADWAMTQANLGSVLGLQGERTGGADGLVLLSASIRAYESALSFYTQRDRPADWAAIQNNLGNVLMFQGERADGTAALALLAASRRALESALSVRTQRDMPADWATTQNNLGNVLKIQSERTGGAAGLALLAVSMRAFESSLRVQTQRDMPADWALTMANVSKAHLAAFSISQDRSSLALARSAAQAAMSVYEGGGMEPQRQKCAQLLEDIAAAERGG